MPKWEFLPNDGGEEEGLGHAGIETYRGSPYPSVARECSQNSLDAAFKRPDGTHSPVHLAFRALEIPNEGVPGLASLQETLKACLGKAVARELPKDKVFFKRALEALRKPHLPVLSIEDSGTTGVIGPAEPGQPFYALVKSSGVSQKADSDAGGSFGIGKNAAFAISSLRTVLYSTLYGTGADETRLTQGKSILVSHESASGEPKRATGYWGADNYKPISGSTGIPAWLNRAEVGTTVAVLGFVLEPDWHWQMIESLIRNFFLAIRKDAICFTVEGVHEEPIEINSNTIDLLFESDKILAASEAAGSTEDLHFSKAMLDATTSPDAVTCEQTFDTVGTFRLRLLQEDGLPKRVGILRNGMYITDNLKPFGHAFARFSLSRDFVAILEPADKATSGRIRDMESPKHDELSADRIDNLEERKKLKSAMKKVGAWVRDVIKSETTKTTDAEILLDEMNRFFATPNSGPEIPDPANKNDDPERLKLVVTGKPSVAPTGTGPAGESGSSGGRKSKSSKNGKTTGGREGKGRGTLGGRGGNSIGYQGLRNSIPDPQTPALRDVAFTPQATGSARLEIAAVGVSRDEALAIRSIGEERCARMPRIELVEGERQRLRIEFEHPYGGPIRLVLNRIEGDSYAD